MKKYLIVILTLLATISSNAQILKPVTWSYAAKKISKTDAIIYLKVKIEDSWHIYASNQKGVGPVKTSFNFMPSRDYALIGKLIEPKPITKYEDTFEMDISYFEKSVVFQQKIKLKEVLKKNQGDTITRPAQVVVKGSVEFMACTNKECLPAETINFSIPIK